MQNSVFECVVDPAQFLMLKQKLLKTYDEEEDSLRFYHLGKKWSGKVEHFGVKETIDVEKDVIIL